MNLSGNLSGMLGPGDLSGANDPRDSRPPLTEAEALAAFRSMPCGEVQEMLNLFVEFMHASDSARARLAAMSSDEFNAALERFSVAYLIGEFEACPLSNLRSRAA